MDLDVEETKCGLVSPESAMFCAHLSHFGYAVQLLPERGFSYRACDEEMSKPLLVVLTLLKIISRYQWYIKYIDFVLQSIVYKQYKKSNCIESINISHRIVLTITKIAVAIRFVQHFEAVRMLFALLTLREDWS